MNIEQLANILSRHIPPAAAPTVAQYLDKYQVQLTIKWARSTKLGDYRSPRKGEKHAISINHNLNPYAFLLTLVHELAHLLTFDKYGHRVAPHGEEWKAEFKQLMHPLIAMKVYPEPLEKVLLNYLRNPKAASCADPHLLRAMNQYNAVPDTFVEQLPLGTFFKVDKERIFQKGEKRRKNYQCIELNSKNIYLVPGLMKVLEHWTNPQ